MPQHSVVHWHRHNPTTCSVPLSVRQLLSQIRPMLSTHLQVEGMNLKAATTNIVWIHTKRRESHSGFGQVALAEEYGLEGHEPVSLVGSSPWCVLKSTWNPWIHLLFGPMDVNFELSWCTYFASFIWDLSDQYFAFFLFEKENINRLFSWTDIWLSKKQIWLLGHVPTKQKKLY